MDHTTDALSETLIGIGVGLSPYVRFDYAMVALASYLLMSVLVFVKTYIEEYILAPSLSFELAVVNNYSLSYFWIWKDFSGCRVCEGERQELDLYHLEN